MKMLLICFASFKHAEEKSSTVKDIRTHDLRRKKVHLKTLENVPEKSVYLLS